MCEYAPVNCHMFIGPNEQARIFRSFEMGKTWIDLRPDEGWVYGGTIEGMF